MDRRAASRWASQRGRKRAGRSAGLTGEALESAVARIAEQFPDNVMRVTVEA